MNELRAVDVLPVELASRVLLGARARARVLRARARDVRRHTEAWVQLHPQEAVQLALAGLYVLSAVVEFAHALRRKGDPR